MVDVEPKDTPDVKFEDWEDVEFAGHVGLLKYADTTIESLTVTRTIEEA